MIPATLKLNGGGGFAVIARLIFLRTSTPVLDPGSRRTVSMTFKASVFKNEVGVRKPAPDGVMDLKESVAR